MTRDLRDSRRRLPFQSSRCFPAPIARRRFPRKSRARNSNAIGNSHAPATIICTGTYWRNAWKYQARTYRHFGWDNGTLLANTLAICAASALPAEIVLGFVDTEINSLLDLDTRREVSLCLVPIGHESGISLTPAATVSALNLETIALSKSEVEYPAMLEMHSASSLESPQEVQQWRDKNRAARNRASNPCRMNRNSSISVAKSRTTIRYNRTSNPSPRFHPHLRQKRLDHFRATLHHLESSTRGLPADFAQPPGAQLNDLYLIVHSVEGLKPGAYFYNRGRNYSPAVENRRSPRRSLLSGFAAGTSRIRLRGYFLSREFKSNPRTLWQSRLPRCPTRSWRHRRQNVSRLLRATPRRHRSHFFRRRRNEFLLAPRRKQKRHLPNGHWQTQKTPFKVDRNMEMSAGAASFGF